MRAVPLLALLSVPGLISKGWGRRRRRREEEEDGGGVILDTSG